MVCGNSASIDYSSSVWGERVQVLTPGSVIRFAALPATSSAKDLYVAFFANDDCDLTISGPSGPSDEIADQTQWTSFEGDEAVGAQGTVPGTQTAIITGASSNWSGFAITLTISSRRPVLVRRLTRLLQPVPVPTCTATPTISYFDSNSSCESGTDSGSADVNRPTPTPTPS
jgi:hypothetical protein